MGSGTDAHDDLAAPLGRWLAESGYWLLTGGGGGVMAAVGEAFAAVAQRSGYVIGVLPGRIDADGNYQALSGYPNPWVDIILRTHLPDSGTKGKEPSSRNHINVLSANVVVALPGAAGTRSEIDLALQYGRPTIACFGDTDVPADFPAVPVARSLADVQEFVHRVSSST
jgi:uncharacterized protein (TIGR00725 family)